MKNSIVSLITVCCFTVGFSQNWTGAVNSDWNNPSNWSQAPQTGDDIVVDFANYTGAMAQPIIANSNFSPAGVLVQGGAILTVQGNITTTDRVEVLGLGTQFLLNSGTVNIAGGAGNARLIFSSGGHFEMNGGILTIGQRLLFELGGTGELNNGSIDVASVFALIDGDITGSSSFVQNGGSIVTAELGMENEAGIYYPHFQQNNGMLTISTGMLFLGVAPGGGSGTFESIGGTTTVGGTIGNTIGSTMNFLLKLDQAAVFNAAVSTITLLPGDTLEILGGALFETGNPNGQQIQNNGVVIGKDATVMVDGTVNLLGSGFYQFPNFTIPAGASVNHVSPQDLRIFNDFNIAGIFSNATNRVVFNGTGLQHLSSPSPITWSKMRVENSGPGVQIPVTVTLNSEGDFMDGLIELTNNAQLNFNPGSIVLNTSDSSFVIGAVQKTGAESFVFPIGEAPMRFRPLTITAPSTIGTSIKVHYFANGFSSLSPVNAPLQTVSTLEYWDVVQTGSTELIGIELGWNDASQSGLVDCASSAIARWNGGGWEFVPSTATGLCAGSNEGSLVSMSGEDLTAAFTFGFTQGVYQQSLQICSGDSISVDTDTYTTTGVYYDYFLDMNGNDSIIVTNLSVNAPIDITVINQITSLLLNTQNGAVQWIDCNTNSPIFGETSTLFIPAQNGAYAAIITVDGCLDTTACELIDELALSEITGGVSLFPNPISKDEMIVVKGITTIASSCLVATNGFRIPLVGSIETGCFLPESCMAGVYFLEIVQESGETTVKKIIVY